MQWVFQLTWCNTNTALPFTCIITTVTSVGGIERWQKSNNSIKVITVTDVLRTLNIIKWNVTQWVKCNKRFQPITVYSWLIGKAVPTCSFSIESGTSVYVIYNHVTAERWGIGLLALKDADGSLTNYPVLLKFPKYTFLGVYTMSNSSR